MSPTTPADNERIARRVPEEIVTEGMFDLIEDVFTEDAIEHNPLGEDTGWDEIRVGMETMLAAFPDLTATVEDTVSDGDTVAMRLTLRGTHDGVFMGIKATGNTIEIGSMVFTRIEDGKIAERWTQPDQLGLMHQLGVVESPGE